MYSTIYSTFKYGKAVYGTVIPSFFDPNIFYQGKPVAHKLRGQIGKTFIYRIRQGNGYAGSTAGIDYQDRYKYFVPSTIEHPNGDAARECFADAIETWKGLPPGLKAWWNGLASKYCSCMGVNLFAKVYMKENYNG